MIQYNNLNQRTIAEFDWPFHTALNAHNRWVTPSQCMYWDALSQGDHKSLSSKRGRPVKDACLVIGAVIIKHKLGLSDRETMSQIQENPYLQYFVGLAGYQMAIPFVPSLRVEVRKRMGDVGLLCRFGKCSIKRLLMRLWRRHAIRYPTDLSLLNEAHEITENIIDALYPHTGLKKKPRTYRRQARKAFLGFGILGNCSCIALLSDIHVAMRRSTSCVHAVVGLVKQRRPKKQALRRALKHPLHYVRRNIGHIEGLMAYWSVEFGSKRSVSLTAQGLSRVDHLSWEAFHEGSDLKHQVERYHERYGYYPTSVIGDPMYGSRENRNYLKEKGIRFSGKPLGTPGNDEINFI